MLRIVSLSEWISKSGYFHETLAEYARARQTGADTTEAVEELTDVMIRGLAYGSPGVMGASRQQLDKAAFEQYSKMASCRFLPLEDVQDDLQIWQLTLLRRPPRKKIDCGYGRAKRRDPGGWEPDPELLKRIYADEEAGGIGGRGGRLGDGTGGPYGPGHGPDGPDGPGQGYGGLGRQTGGFGSRGGKGGRNGLGGEYSDEELDENGKPIGKGGRRIDLDDDGKDGPGGRSGSKDSVDSQGNPRHGGKDGQLGDEDGKDGPGGAHGKTLGGSGGPDAEERERRRRESQQRRQSAQQSGKLGGKDDSGEKGDTRTEEEKRREEEEKLLAAGHLFRIKAKEAMEEVLDEFANMLLPPPPLSGVPGESGEGGDGGEGEDGSPTGSKTRRGFMKGMMPPVSFSAGIRSCLAEDFRKAIGEAFHAIDFPEKKTDDDDTLLRSFLDDDLPDPAMKRLLSRSNMPASLRGDSTHLASHLRMRAEKHGRRLQAHTEKAVQSNQDRWPRRLTGCRQSLRGISALDAFAEMRAREKLATA